MRAHPRVPLGEQLVGVSGRCTHHREDLGDVMIGDTVVEPADMELTNTLRGLRHRGGASRRSGCKVTSKPFGSPPIR